MTRNVGILLHHLNVLFKFGLYVTLITASLPLYQTSALPLLNQVYFPLCSPFVLIDPLRNHIFSFSWVIDYPHNPSFPLTILPKIVSPFVILPFSFPPLGSCIYVVASPFPLRATEYINQPHSPRGQRSERSDPSDDFDPPPSLPPQPTLNPTNFYLSPTHLTMSM